MSWPGKLAAALAPPSDDSQARERFERFRRFVADLRGQAAPAGLPPPQDGFIPFFLSFFWEAQARERWPIY